MNTWLLQFDPVSVPVYSTSVAFKLAPPGSDPDCTAKLVASVAATVKLIVPVAFATDIPKLPASSCPCRCIRNCK